MSVNKLNAELPDHIKTNVDSLFRVLSFPLPIMAAIAGSIVTKNEDIEIFTLKLDVHTASIISLCIVILIFMYCVKLTNVIDHLFNVCEDDAEIYDRSLLYLKYHPSIFNPFFDGDCHYKKIIPYIGVIFFSVLATLSVTLPSHFLLAPAFDLKATAIFYWNNIEFFLLFLFGGIIFFFFIQSIFRLLERVNERDMLFRIGVFGIVFFGISLSEAILR